MPLILLAVVIIVLILFVLLLKFYLLSQHNKSKSLRNYEDLHVVITGGSSGIGLAIAKECYNNISNISCITLIARNKKRLEVAKNQLLSSSSSTNATNKKEINIISVDITNYDDICKAIEQLPDPDILFNVAGMSIAKQFKDTTPDEFLHLLKVNYLGSVNATHAFLPKMMNMHDNDNTTKANTKLARPKTIVYTSSMAGQLGVYGYTAYSGSKFALRGFAESLCMELAPHNIIVQLAYPPDTDTPGYELENIGKPKECMLISEDGGLWDATVIANKMVKSALEQKQFHVYFGIDGWMLSTLNAGMSPPLNSIIDTLYQIFLMGLLRFISLFYLKKYSDIVWNCLQERANGIRTTSNDKEKNN